jgi:hypothetical protein
LNGDQEIELAENHFSALHGPFGSMLPEHPQNDTERLIIQTNVFNLNLQYK